MHQKTLLKAGLIVAALVLFVFLAPIMGANYTQAIPFLGIESVEAQEEPPDQGSEWDECNGWLSPDFDKHPCRGKALKRARAGIGNSDIMVGSFYDNGLPEPPSGDRTSTEGGTDQGWFNWGQTPGLPKDFLSVKTSCGTGPEVCRPKPTATPTKRPTSTPPPPPTVEPTVEPTEEPTEVPPTKTPDPTKVPTPQGMRSVRTGAHCPLQDGSPDLAHPVPYVEMKFYISHWEEFDFHHDTTKQGPHDRGWTSWAVLKDDRPKDGKQAEVTKIELVGEKFSLANSRVFEVPLDNTPIKEVTLPRVFMSKWDRFQLTIVVNCDEVEPTATPPAASPGSPPDSGGGFQEKQPDSRLVFIGLLIFAALVATLVRYTLRHRNS